MSITVAENLIVSPNGDILMTTVEDSEPEARDAEYIRKNGNGWTANKTMRKAMCIPPIMYHYWCNQTGSNDCWKDKHFLNFIRARNPEIFIGST